MRPRIEQELVLLRQMYGEVEHVEEAGEDWFRLPRYTAPAGWRIGETAAQELSIAFLIKADYPGAPPYGFLAPEGINFGGTGPNNTGDPPKPVPFPGDWIHFSWSVDNWAATGEVCKGSNLLAWCRSFAVRLREGA
jgi:hypothetical protein